MTDNTKALFWQFKFPAGINYCDFEKLTKEEKLALWDDYCKSMGGEEIVRKILLGDDCAETSNGENGYQIDMIR